MLYQNTLFSIHCTNHGMHNSNPEIRILLCNLCFFAFILYCICYFLAQNNAKVSVQAYIKFASAVIKIILLKYYFGRKGLMLYRFTCTYQKTLFSLAIIIIEVFSFCGDYSQKELI